MKLLFILGPKINAVIDGGVEVEDTVVVAQRLKKQQGTRTTRTPMEWKFSAVIERKAIEKEGNDEEESTDSSALLHTHSFRGARAQYVAHQSVRSQVRNCSCKGETSLTHLQAKSFQHQHTQDISWLMRVWRDANG